MLATTRAARKIPAIRFMHCSPSLRFTGSMPTVSLACVTALLQSVQLPLKPAKPLINGRLAASSLHTPLTRSKILGSRWQKGGNSEELPLFYSLAFAFYFPVYG